MVHSVGVVVSSSGSAATREIAKLVDVESMHTDWKTGNVDLVLDELAVVLNELDSSVDGGTALWV